MDFTGKKLLILGKNFGAYDVALEAKKMGLYIIAADYLEDGPIKQMADEAWLVSTNDIDTLEIKCREIGVDGVMFGTSDFNINCARKLCKRLGLSIFGDDEYAVQVTYDKAEFKRICEKVGAPVATSYRLTDELAREDLDKIVYPVVVKPVDKAANTGVSYCNNEEELIEAYRYARSISNNPTIICERQLHGPEFVAHYVLANGDSSLLFFTREHHQTGELANLYSMINSTSNGLKTWLDEANEKVKQAFKEAKFEDGIAWVETILDEDGHFYIIEPGYRFSSETTYALYEKVSGFNSMRWYIETALGIKHTKEDLPKDLDRAYESLVGAYHLFTCKDGTVASINGVEEIEALGNITVDIARKVGDPVKNHTCMGLVRIYADSYDEFEEKFKKVNNLFSINDENGDNLFIRFTDYENVKFDFVKGLEEFSK